MGPTKSTGHIPSRHENIITVATICTVIAVLVFVTRLWVRLRLTRAGLGMDDWTISLAMVTYLPEESHQKRTGTGKWIVWEDLELTLEGCYGGLDLFVRACYTNDDL